MSIANVEPVVELIAQALHYRLNLLTAGYSAFTPVCEVVRPVRQGGFTPKHLQIVLTQGAPERDEAHDVTCALAYRVVFNIRCHVLPSEKDPTPIDTVVNRFAADVQRVVCDTANELPSYTSTAWHTFRDYALLSEWQSHEAIEIDGSFGGVNVPLQVLYRVEESNPFVKR